MDKRNYAFGKTNFILLAVGMLIVVVGFCLMSGGGSDETVFDASIFDTRCVPRGLPLYDLCHRA
jgi:hypothetical protein